MTSRNWCITINNQECSLDHSVLDANLKILVYQLERGEQGTIHLQGYLELHAPCRLAALKKLFPTAHLEVRKGTRLQAVEYCTKEESRVSGPYLYHHRGLDLQGYLHAVKTTGGGNNTALQEIKELLQQEDYSELKLADEHFDHWVRHYKAFREYKRLKTPPRNDFKKLVVVVGPSGTGKSRFARDQYPHAYWKQRSQWWDGYSGEKVVILDEFYGWLPYDLLLRLCDRYPLLLETKGGQVQCSADTVVITSNLNPNQWYKNVYHKALYRRISTILLMRTLGETQHFSNMDDFLKINF